MRKLGWTLGSLATAAGAAIALSIGSQPAEAVAGEIFQMTGTARFLHFHTPIKAGKTVFINNANGALITKAIKNPASFAGNFLEQDSGGKSYLRFTSLTQWDMALTTAFSPPEQVMTLNGFVDGKGNYMFRGYHTRSDTTFIAKGVVVFKTGTLRPLSISGQVWGVSPLSQHFATGTLKSVKRVTGP